MIISSGHAALSSLPAAEDEDLDETSFPVGASVAVAASPDAGDPSGKSSRFALQDAELIEELEHAHAAAKLSVLIGGKSYRGDIKHDHAGHDHAH